VEKRLLCLIPLKTDHDILIEDVESDVEKVSKPLAGCW